MATQRCYSWRVDETQFIALAGTLGAAFVWMIGMRSRARSVRVVGVVVLIGAWLVFRLIQRA
jgi:hypothetical protein